jgi:peptide deformylase
MAVRPIITIPNKGLYEKTEKVRQIDQAVSDVAKDLVDTVRVAKDPEGAGLSANQMGVSKRMCVVRNFFKDPQNPDKILSEDIVLINPKIVSRSKETEVDWEGCLSVPDVYGKVERFQKVKVSALGVDGKDIKLKVSGFLARTVQHEIDHLDGILFTEKVIGQTITEEELDKIVQ